jgi:hypothetical protein
MWNESWASLRSKTPRPIFGLSSKGYINIQLRMLSACQVQVFHTNFISNLQYLETSTPGRHSGFSKTSSCRRKCKKTLFYCRRCRCHCHHCYFSAVSLHILLCSLFRISTLRYSARRDRAGEPPHPARYFVDPYVFASPLFLTLFPSFFVSVSLSLSLSLFDSLSHTHTLIDCPFVYELK